mmetsp:Transcript_4756/g.7951  ORF Transcript_4756/g.7951 Transcript_4756/m.7951 type:complete len:235 (-) Transcript_4756:41-745(-)
MCPSRRVALPRELPSGAVLPPPAPFRAAAGSFRKLDSKPFAISAASPLLGGRLGTPCNCLVPRAAAKSKLLRLGKRDSELALLEFTVIDACRIISAKCLPSQLSTVKAVQAHASNGAGAPGRTLRISFIAAVDASAWSHKSRIAPRAHSPLSRRAPGAMGTPVLLELSSRGTKARKLRITNSHKGTSFPNAAAAPSALRDLRSLVSQAILLSNKMKNLSRVGWLAVQLLLLPAQ